MIKANSLLRNDVQWESYHEEELSLSDFAHIFVMRTNIYQDTPARFAGILSSGELSRASRFFHASDRINFMVRRSMLRHLAGKILTTEPALLHFRERQNNKPALSGLEFNVSHTKDYAVIAFSRTSIGTDIEYIDTGFKFRDILAGHFSAPEISFVKSSENELQNFYTVWTRKEALLKATGEGLINNLNEVRTLQEEQVRTGTQYLLHSFQLNNHYLISIASANTWNNIKMWQIENPISF